MTERTKQETINHIHKCLNYGMKDPNSIYQSVLDNVIDALSNSETEMFIYNYLNNTQ